MPPRDSYLDEWTFIPLAKDQKLPLAADNDTPPEILYSVDSVDDLPFQQDTGLKKKGRKDYIQKEIEKIYYGLKPEDRNAKTVMKHLKKQSGQPAKSCVVSVDIDKIIWRSPKGDKDLNMRSLGQRIFRLHNKQCGQ